MIQTHIKPFPAVFLLFFLMFTFSSLQAIEPEKSLGVVYADGRNTEDVSLYRAEDGSEELYITAYDLARVFRATKFWSPGSRKLVLRISGERYLFTLDTRVVLVDDEPVLLHVPEIQHHLDIIQRQHGRFESDNHHDRRSPVPRRQRHPWLT